MDLRPPALRPPSLPIDDYLHTIVEQVRTRRAIVVTAAPGAGKTTRAPHRPGGKK